MKDLRLYKGFKPLSFIQDKHDVRAKIEVDGLIHEGFLFNRCTCGIKDPIHGKHKKGCNEFWLSTSKYVDRIKDTKIFNVIKFPNTEDRYELHIKIGEIEYEGSVSLRCTCGMYLYGNKISDHPHQDCQVRKKLEMNQVTVDA